MHPDHKMGLAVGLALLGLVGAMFFRRDSHSDDVAPPELENVAEIDDEIAGTPHAPYLKVIDDISDDAPGKIKGARSHTAKKPVAGTEAALDEAEERATDEVTLLPAPHEESDPIRHTARKDPPAADVPAHNRDWQPTKSKTAAGVTSTNDTAAPGFQSSTGANSTPNTTVGKKGSRTHTIQPGDTLSRIAEKYLGSPRHYREIYQANRDRLRSVDDLPEGVTLVIPDGPANSTARPTADPQKSAAETARTRLVDDEGDDPLRRDGARREETSKPFKLQFEPVRRGPFATPGGGRGNDRRSRRPDTDVEAQPILSGIEVDDGDDQSDADEPLIKRK